MIANPRQCLKPTELADVVGGRMPPADFDSALVHVDHCDDCRAAIESFDQHEPWIVDGLDGQGSDPLHAETACQVALGQMLQPSAQIPRFNSAQASAPPCSQLGPYVLLSTLGAGGMGTVYLAKHDRLKRQCAIKLLPRERVDQPGWLERFDREMTAVANLEHANVVRATDAGHQDGWHYLVMEYLDGLDVGRIANRMHRIDVADACEIIRQAALGLQHIHQSDLVHRDIKPSNLMLCREGQVKILDLGLVLAGDDPLSKDDRLTTVGHLMGTMPYMAPEQLADSRDVDARADIYALGATLFRLIVGRPPHKRHRNLAAHVLAITHDDAPPMAALRDDLDPALVALVAQMLARDPDDRPATAADVADQLKAFSHGSGLKSLLRQSLRRSADESPSHHAMPSVSMQQSPTNNRPRRWLIAAAAGALLLVAGMLFKIQTDRGTLVIHSDQDGLTVLVKQSGELVERLVISQESERRTVLRKGTYRVEIEGGGQPLMLSDDVVTIGRGEIAKVNVLAANTPSDNQRLFRGKPLQHWMSMLRREEDINAIGLAMDAVEKLTRELDGKVDLDARRAAASLSAERARKLGGTLGIGNAYYDDEDPSARFVAYFTKVFPGYFADPGLEVLDRELSQGTARSKVSAIWAFHDYLHGVSHSSVSKNRPVGARSELHNLATTADGRQRCQSILDHLRTLSDTISMDFQGRESALELADEAAFILAISINDTLVGNDSMEQKIRQDMQDYLEGLAGTTDAAGIGHWPDANLLIGAARLGEHSASQEWWDHMAATFLTMGGYIFETLEAPFDREVYDAIARVSPNVLEEQAKKLLQEYLQDSLAIDESQISAAIANAKAGRFGTGGRQIRYTPLRELAFNKNWRCALEFLAHSAAKHSDDAQQLHELLTAVRVELQRHKLQHQGYQQPYAAIDRAIDIVHPTANPSSSQVP